MLANGTMKVIKAPQIVAQMEPLGVPAARLPLLGALQIAGAAGLAVGLLIHPLGVAAAIGLVLYFAGAIVTHLRAHDRAVQGAVFFLALSVATLVVLLISA
ncbi:MAG: DoxX family protein [Actinobacteria bacterium]|nr:DoxX family protein [Actinomycetota bacterium]